MSEMDTNTWNEIEYNFLNSLALYIVQLNFVQIYTLTWFQNIWIHIRPGALYQQENCFGDIDKNP